MIIVMLEKKLLRFFLGFIVATIASVTDAN